MPTFRADVPSLEALLDRVEELAPLPQAASRVIGVTEDDRFSAYDLAAIIATDTALTAKILRLANSASYGFPRRIATVRDAVVLIGFRSVRSMAIAASILDLITVSSESRFNGDLFWGHSVACGLAAEAMARESRDARPDEAFTAGVLHDVGRLVLSQYAADAFGRALYLALQEARPLIDVERSQFGYDHAQVGAGLAQRWHFPDNVREAIADHHDLAITADRSGLTYVVAHANALCHRHRLWCGLDTDEGARVYPSQYSSTTNDPIFAAVHRRLGGRAEIEERVRDFIQNANERSIQWYSPASSTPAEPANDAAA